MLSQYDTLFRNYAGLIVALFLVLGGCSLLGQKEKAEPIDGCQTGTHPIYGSWLWLSSSGGIMGETKTPDSEGYARTACFSADNTFAFYQADTLILEGTFALTTGDSTEAVLVEVEEDSVTIIRYGVGSEERMMEQVVTFAGTDTLILADQCYDCYVSAYKRIEE